MITLRETKELIDAEPDNWALHLMNFVDDFRRNRDARSAARFVDAAADPRVTGGTLDE